MITRRRRYLKRRLKDAVTANVETEARAAKCDGIYERRAGHVFDDVRNARTPEQCARMRNEIRAVLYVSGTPFVRRKRLAWRRGPNEIHVANLVSVQSIRLHEFERVVGLRLDVDAHNLKTGAVESHAGAACPTEKIECFHLGVFSRRL